MARSPESATNAWALTCIGPALTDRGFSRGRADLESRAREVIESRRWDFDTHDAITVTARRFARDVALGRATGPWSRRVLRRLGRRWWGVEPLENAR